MSIKTFRDLKVWQKSMDVVKEIYKISANFPGDEKYVLTPQLRRAAISVPSNIAEGYGRNATKDYKRFLQISMGSIYELQTQVEIAFEVNYFNDKEKYIHLQEKLNELTRMLHSLINKINQ